MYAPVAYSTKEGGYMFSIHELIPRMMLGSTAKTHTPRLFLCLCISAGHVSACFPQLMGADTAADTRTCIPHSHSEICVCPSQIQPQTTNPMRIGSCQCDSYLSPRIFTRGLQKPQTHIPYDPFKGPPDCIWAVSQN